MQYLGSEYGVLYNFLAASIHIKPPSSSGYLESCRSIVNCTRSIANTIKSSIPELYIIGSPPASVVAFGSRDPSVNVLEVGDAMSKRGWHLNGISGPPAVHIACTVRKLVVNGTITFS